MSKKATSEEKKYIQKSLLGDEGRRLVPTFFGTFPGRELRGIIDGQGRVFCPNPYDMPKDPHRILAFALHLILAMINTGRINADAKDGHFVTQQELVKYQALTEELLHGVDVVLLHKEKDHRRSITRQESGRINRSYARRLLRESSKSQSVK